MKNKFSNKKIIDNGQYKFQRAIETGDRIFYRAFEERLKVGTVMMLDRTMNILDTGVDAYREFKTAIKTGNYSWVSEKMKIYLEKRK
jgi:hypothetical protein